MNKSIRRLRTEDSMDLGENIHIYYKDTYDYAPKGNDWTTTDYQRKKERQ